MTNTPIADWLLGKAKSILNLPENPLTFEENALKELTKIHNKMVESNLYMCYIGNCKESLDKLQPILSKMGISLIRDSRNNVFQCIDRKPHQEKAKTGLIKYYADRVKDHTSPLPLLLFGLAIALLGNYLLSTTNFNFMITITVPIIVITTVRAAIDNLECKSIEYLGMTTKKLNSQDSGLFELR